MGNCCTDRRFHNEDLQTDGNSTNSNRLNTNQIFFEDLKTEEITDQTLKKRFLIASQQENIIGLFSFLENNSILELEEDVYLDFEKVWMALPETISDLAMYKIHSIISSKVNLMKFNTEKIDLFIGQLKEAEFVEKILFILNMLKFEISNKIGSDLDNDMGNSNNFDVRKQNILNNSNNLNSFSVNINYNKFDDLYFFKQELDYKTRKGSKFFKNCNEDNNGNCIRASICKSDFGLLSLAKISNFKDSLDFLFTDTQFEAIVDYLSFIQHSQLVKTKEHSIICLELLRNLYVGNNKLRKKFISSNGIMLIHEYLSIDNDIDILHEAVLSLQDLIYVMFFYRKLTMK